MGTVTAGDCINVGVYSGGVCASGCSSSSSSSYVCPVVPGNGLAINEPGANPMKVTAAEAISAFYAVTMGTGGVVNADRATVAHNGKVLGLVDNSYAPLQTANVVTGGPLTNPIAGVGGWNWTLLQDVYLDLLGALTQVIPTSGFLNKIGFALSSNTMFIDIERVQSTGQVKVAQYAYAATLTVDFNNTDVAVIAPLTGPITLDFANGRDGQRIQVRLTQDAVGGRVVTYGATVETNATPPTLTTAANRTDILTFQYDAIAAKYLLVAAYLDFA